MRFYVNSKYKLVCAPDYHDKFGDVTSSSIQIYNNRFTENIEDDINMAVNAVLEKYNNSIPKGLVDELIEEKKRQTLARMDTSIALTDFLDNEVQS